MKTDESVLCRFKAFAQGIAFEVNDDTGFRNRSRCPCLWSGVDDTQFRSMDFLTQLCIEHKKYKRKAQPSDL